MTHKEFIDKHDLGPDKEAGTGNYWIENGYLIVRSLPLFTDMKQYTELPEKIVFECSGLTQDLTFDDIEEIPHGVTFMNSGYLSLYRCMKVAPGTVFRNGGVIKMNLIEELPEGTEFNNRANVSLPSLKKLSPNIKFNNAGEIFLFKVNSFGKGIEFNNINNIYCSIPSPKKVNKQYYFNIVANQLAE